MSKEKKHTLGRLIKDQENKIAGLEAELAACYSYAKTLFGVLAPQCVVSEDLISLLTQIDNWCAGRKNLEADNIALVNELAAFRWVSVSERLPEMFTTVFVYGVMRKRNVCHQAWAARRWSGFTSGWPGWKEGKDPPWNWCTPCDFHVEDVTHWMPILRLPKGVKTDG